MVCRARTGGFDTKHEKDRKSDSFEGNGPIATALCSRG